MPPAARDLNFQRSVSVCGQERKTRRYLLCGPEPLWWAASRGACVRCSSWQNDTGNRHSPTVIAAAITSQTGKAKLPTHIALAARQFGLRRTRWSLLEQIRTLDKKRLREHMGLGRRPHDAPGGRRHRRELRPAPGDVSSDPRWPAGEGLPPVPEGSCRGKEARASRHRPAGRARPASRCRPHCRKPLHTSFSQREQKWETRSSAWRWASFSAGNTLFRVYVSAFLWRSALRTGRSIRAGTPPTTVSGGTSRVNHGPGGHDGPVSDGHPGGDGSVGAIHTFFPMTMGAGMVSLRCSGSSLWFRVASTTLWPIRAPSPMVMPPWSWKRQPLFRRDVLPDGDVLAVVGGEGAGRGRTPRPPACR